MASLTPNYKLKKPADADFYDVGDFNGNMDIVDTQITRISTETNNLKALIGEDSSSSNNTVMAKLNQLLTNLQNTINNLSAMTSTLSTISTNLDSTTTKLNTLTTNVNTLIKTPKVIKQVLRGTATGSTTGNRMTISLGTILNSNRCFVLLNNSVVGRTMGIQHGAYSAIFSGLNLLVYGNFTEGNGEIGHAFSWEIVEFY